jgi:hypothetical protein
MAPRAQEFGLSRNSVWRGVAVLIVLVAALPAAAAETYPSQRITLIVPFPPGSATDSVTRHLAETFAQQPAPPLWLKISRAQTAILPHSLS